MSFEVFGVIALVVALVACKATTVDNLLVSSEKIRKIVIQSVMGTYLRSYRRLKDLLHMGPFAISIWQISCPSEFV